jgi:ribosome-associated protein YbcJ (S4-like RNA binding protein)
LFFVDGENERQSRSKIRKIEKNSVLTVLHNIEQNLEGFKSRNIGGSSGPLNFNGRPETRRHMKVIIDEALISSDELHIVSVVCWIADNSFSSDNSADG